MINNLSTFSQNYNQRLNKTQSFSSKENQTTSASMTNKTSMPYYEPETVPDVFEKINSSYKQTSTVNNNQKIYKSVPEAILNNKDYKKAIDYVDSENKQKKYKNVKKYVNNPDFDSLAQSKFFKDPEGKFEKLLDIVSALDKTHETSYKKVHSPFYRPKYSPDTNSLYANIDVNGCLSNLNKFFSSNVNDSVKQNLLDNTDKLKDIWFVDNNLKDFDKNPNVNILSNTFAIL